MILTKEIFEQGKSRNGAWNGKQLALFGLVFSKMKKGWKKTIIGKDYDESKIQEFLRLKDSHLPFMTETEKLENEIAEMEKQLETLPSQIFEKKNTLAEMRLQEAKEKRNELKRNG